jgi:hypothetical protein
LQTELDEQTVYRVLACLVKTCGGERVYIPVKLDPPKPVLPTDTPKTVQQRLNVSRSTSYRLLNRHRI